MNERLITPEVVNFIKLHYPDRFEGCECPPTGAWYVDVQRGDGATRHTYLFETLEAKENWIAECLKAFPNMRRVGPYALDQSSTGRQFTPPTAAKEIPLSQLNGDSVLETGR